jgi:hypothetical protein
MTFAVTLTKPTIGSCSIVESRADTGQCSVLRRPRRARRTANTRPRFRECDLRPRRASQCSSVQVTSGANYDRDRKWCRATVFTQTDPMPMGAGSSYEQSYAYAGNNPAVYIDPSGLRKKHGCNTGVGRTLGANLLGLGRFLNPFNEKDSFSLCEAVSVGRWMPTMNQVALRFGDYAAAEGAISMANSAAGRINGPVGPVGLLTAEELAAMEAESGVAQAGAVKAASNKGPTLFRGTSAGFPGSPGVQQLGITPASTDPAVAAAFATEASQYGNGVVQIASPGNLAGAKMYPPTLGGLEAEIPVGLSPAQFASQAGTTISAAQARSILNEMGVSVPGRISSPEALNTWLQSRTPMTASQIAEFVRRATGS